MLGEYEQMGVRFNGEKPVDVMGATSKSITGIIHSH